MQMQASHNIRWGQMRILYVNTISLRHNSTYGVQGSQYKMAAGSIPPTVKRNVAACSSYQDVYTDMFQEENSL